MKYITLYCLLLLPAIMFGQEKFSIYFDVDKAISNNDDAVSAWLKDNKGAEVLKVYGYTDSTGTAAYNKKLSERRAAHVYSLLTADTKASNAERKGFGEAESGSADMAKDRRVDIYYIKPVSELAAQVSESKLGDKLRLPGLNFYNHSDIVLPESEPVLYKLLDIMRNSPNLKIEIQGHICCQSQEVENISVRRAKTVYDFLIKNGIAKDRLAYRGFASTRPIYPRPEKNEAERVANRRVEIEIVAN